MDSAEAAQFGYNRQAGSAVWSVESDFNYLGLNQFYGGTFITLPTVRRISS